jgi:hypothetical protein
MTEIIIMYIKLPCDLEVAKCKEMPVIPVNKVVDKKRMI